MDNYLKKKNLISVNPKSYVKSYDILESMGMKDYTPVQEMNRNGFIWHCKYSVYRYGPSTDFII